VIRGGSWYEGEKQVRAADRSWRLPNVRFYGVGFRIVRK
jgi:formylglycine-generating enzyme required for sulfatase activity